MEVRGKDVFGGKEGTSEQEIRKSVPSPEMKEADRYEDVAVSE